MWPTFRSILDRECASFLSLEFWLLLAVSDISDEEGKSTSSWKLSSLLSKLKEIKNALKINKVL
jgi:hypothetical protein